MLALTQFTGPRDAFISFMSYARRQTSALAKAMPPELISDALAGEANYGKKLPRSIGETKQMLQPVADKIERYQGQGWSKVRQPPPEPSDRVWRKLSILPLPGLEPMTWLPAW